MKAGNRLSGFPYRSSAGAAGIPEGLLYWSREAVPAKKNPFRAEGASPMRRMDHGEFI
jgi:hypothetical protein